MLRQMMILGLAGALAVTATIALADGGDHRGIGAGQREGYRHDGPRAHHGEHDRRKSRRWERAERKRHHWQHGHRKHWRQHGRHGHGYFRDRRYWARPHHRHSGADHLAPVLIGAALACSLHH